MNKPDPADGGHKLLEGSRNHGLWIALRTKLAEECASEPGIKAPVTSCLT